MDQSSTRLYTFHNAEDSHTSIYGHSMCIYKGGAYVFGGSRQESSTNELTYINLKNMKSTQLPPAPHRRK